MRNGSVFASTALVAALVVCCALLLPAAAAWSQQAGAPPAPPNMQNAEKAWEAQATWVAQDLKLNPEQTTKLVDAYKAARKGAMDAMAAQMSAPGARPDREAMRKIGDEQRAKFETTLKGFLNPEQTTKALAPLGTFNRRWDRMVTALDSLKLDDAAKAKAMPILANSAMEADKAIRSAMDSGNREGMRDTMMKINEKLDTDLGAVLSPEQMTQFKAATAMRSGGAGREGRREEAPAPAPTPAPAPVPAPAK